MTTEKAIELLNRLQDEQFDGVHGDERREALEMAVRALEQNLGNNGSICTKTGVNDEDRTTDDSISRKMAIDAVAKWVYDVFGIKESDGTATIFKRLRELPSAQTERKMGKWIKISPANIYECSECGKNVLTDDISAYDFCHGCGARMDGGESDDLY